MSSGATTEHMVSSPARAAPENCGQGERALWSAVVQQAIDDVMDEPIGSLIYDDAVAFFTHTGEWAVSRTHIADELGIHADDLARAGRRITAQRRLSEGMPADTPIALPQPARRRCVRHTGPLPRLEAVFLPPPPKERQHYVRRWVTNPAFRFDPSRALPSERRVGT